jgi:hypothetical protein
MEYKMIKYRILTNGTKFKIQTRFLLFFWADFQIWEMRLMGESWETELFDTLEAAQDKVFVLLEQDSVNKAHKGWRIVA